MICLGFYKTFRYYRLALERFTKDLNGLNILEEHVAKLVLPVHLNRSLIKAVSANL